jgi:hypothetical protein
VQKLSEFDCVHHSRRGFFGFLNTLAQLLLKALKLTEQTIFAASKKTPHQSVRLEKKPETLPREQPNETYCEQPDAGGIPAGRGPGHGR